MYGLLLACLLICCSLESRAMERIESGPTRPTFARSIDSFVKSRASPRIPIILVPGWGFDLAPSLYGQEVFGRYRNWFIEAGYRSSDIHVLHYRYHSYVTDIGRELGYQMQQIVGRYPSKTKFDMMGHSLGGFVGLYAMMESGLGSRLRKFVSLSGIPFGWNSEACSSGWCGKAHLSLTPFRSPFVMTFHRKYQRVLAKVEKCSLFSRTDEFVRPFDAGKFSDGVNVEVAGMRHMDVVWKRSCFEEMLRHCYRR